MNPELRRNLWLEMGWHRRIAAPAVILLVLGLFAAGAGPDVDWRRPVHSTALTLAFLVLYLWGARQAAEAVSDEVRDRTWDLQRLSALGPWAMTWGKLLGATVFPWYAGTFCLAAVAITSPGVPESAPAGWLLAAIVAGAVTLHGAALGASLQAVRKDSKSGQRFATLFILIPVLLAIWMLPFFGARQAGSPVEWYWLDAERMTFIALSFAVFAAWAVFGAYRCMCRELQVRTLPWAWPAFAAYLAFWLAGFAPSDEGLAPRAFVAFGLLASVTLTYFALFSEPTTAMGIRRVVLHARAGNWRRALEEVPVWMTSLVLGLFFALAAMAVFRDAYDLVPGVRWDALQRIAMFAPLALVLLAARDCAILVFFASAARPRRVEGATFLYLVLLSWVIPGLLAALGLGAAAQVLMPFATLDGPRAALVMGVQAALAWGFAVWRWRSNYGRAPTA